MIYVIESKNNRAVVCVLSNTANINNDHRVTMQYFVCLC